MTPIAATSTIVRSSPVIRETSVATAMVPAARRMFRLAPGAPSRAATSSPDPPGSPGACVGTGGRDVITWVSSAAAGTHCRRAAGGGIGGNGRAGVTSCASAAGGGAGGAASSGPGNGAEGGGAAR
ncbi:hypothetical protein GCM10010531_34380 [Blastococcus jejuensis]|uniref:Uncharacterized protein n=1 Tax=Blastococcus jejuensis TaxID=351224 RepID=A0ABP6PHX9_9ACTN